MGSLAENRSSDYSWYQCKYYYRSGGSSEGLYILLCTYAVEGIVGGPLNLWLLLHIMKKRRQQKGVPSADILPLQLTLIHLLFYLTLLPLLWNHMHLESERLFSGVTKLTGSVLTLKPVLYCLLCLERYLAVVRPISYLSWRARKYQWGALAVSCAVYVIMTSYTAFIQRSNIIMSALFLVVLLIELFCSLSILRALRQAPPGDQHNSRVRAEMTAVKRKAFITVLLLQAALILNYLPLVLSSPMSSVLPSGMYQCQVQMLAMAAAFSCSYLQPLFYLQRLGRLQLLCHCTAKTSTEGKTRP